MKDLNNIEFVEVTRDNVSDVGVYCIKNPKAAGYKVKLDWFKKQTKNGLKIIIAIDKETGKQLGFIEFIDSEYAWRPIVAKNYLFIQCIALFGKGRRSRGIATRLVKMCENEAVRRKKSGVCTMTSEGPWMATRKLFEKINFSVSDELDRFELLSKPINRKSPAPKFADWESSLKKYEGWNLVYSDQCPWHENAVSALSESAKENGIELTVKRLSTPKKAQNAPSGFGTFSLVRDGRLLADHYISKTRFKNILKKELA